MIGRITTGAQNDLEKVTQMAYAQVRRSAGTLAGGVVFKWVFGCIAACSVCLRRLAAALLSNGFVGGFARRVILV
jgi:hypothetical protein